MSRDCLVGKLDTERLSRASLSPKMAHTSLYAQRALDQDEVGRFFLMRPIRGLEVRNVKYSTTLMYCYPRLPCEERYPKR